MTGAAVVAAIVELEGDVDAAVVVEVVDGPVMRSFSDWMYHHHLERWSCTLLVLVCAMTLFQFSSIDSPLSFFRPRVFFFP